MDLLFNNLDSRLIYYVLISKSTFSQEDAQNKKGGCSKGILVGRRIFTGFVKNMRNDPLCLHFLSDS